MAQLIDGLCRRYHQPPSVILQEDASYVMHMLTLADAASEDKEEEDLG